MHGICILYNIYKDVVFEKRIAVYSLTLSALPSQVVYRGDYNDYKIIQDVSNNILYKLNSHLCDKESLECIQIL